MPALTAAQQQLVGARDALTAAIAPFVVPTLDPPPVDPPPISIPPSAAPSNAVIFDGPGGASSDGPYAAYLDIPTWATWKNQYGDWLDALGVQQGQTAFASLPVLAGRTGAVTLDVTSFVVKNVEPQMALRGGGTAVIVLKSRESGAGPRLLMSYVDGTAETIPVMFDAGDDPSTLFSDSTGRVSYTIGGLYVAYLRFPAATKPIKTATLEVTIEKVWAAGAINVFRFAQHLDEPDPYYPTLVNPVFSTEAFEPGSIPAYLNDSIWRVDTLKQLKVVSTPAGKVLECRFDPTFQGITNANILFPDANGKFGIEHAHVAFKYDVTILDDFLPSLGQGGKFCFGFCGPTHADDTIRVQQFGIYPGSAGTPAVGGGAQSNGKNGWSLRGLFHENYPIGHPLRDRLRIGTYAYYGRMPGWNNPNGANGENWQWSQFGDGLLTPGVRRTITQELRMNTAGVADGMLRVWLDGRLTFTKNDIFIRDVGPYDVTKEGVLTDMLIRSIYFNEYHGGHKLPIGKGGVQVSNVRVYVL